MKYKNIFVLLTVIAILFAYSIKMNAQVTGIYFSNDQIEAVKRAVDAHDEKIMPFVHELKKQADKMMKKGPWTITSVSAPTPSGNPHDYFSEGRYWWPNPKDPNGKYIRKDGLTNPDIFRAHTKMLNQVYDAVYYLSMAAYFLGNQKYADHAAKIISVWFLNPETKMNPNLNFAQAIRGVTEGRGTGIVDMHRYSMFPEAINLLEASGKWNNKDYNSLKNWFRQFLNWLLTSKNGKHEMNSGNNHATWWAAQAMAYSIFLNDTSVYNMLIEHTKKDLIGKEIEPNGSCPREEARTRSMHYSVFNQEAFSLICTMASLRGIDIWTYSTPESGSVKKSIDYLLPYLQGKEKWQKQNIVPFEGEQPLSLALAYLHFKNPGYWDQYVKMGTDNKIMFNEQFKLLVDLVLAAQH